jgi:methionine-rich copper-binding protein CopC
MARLSQQVPSSGARGRPDVLIVPLVKPLTPSVYTVTWHAVSADTHCTQGTFKFTVK